MPFPSDLEIAQNATPRPLADIAGKLALTEKDYEPYGRHIGKLSRGLLEAKQDNPDGKLILVTAMTPTKAGEGKSTTTVGLGDALSRLGRKTVIAMREPSLGPCFGTKGGATGGGYAQVIPMEEINLHFTGDIHAVSMAHNLLSAMVANHIHHGNEKQLDPRRVQWKHVVDLNARHLRQIVCALGGPTNGQPMESGFDISTASEVMAILCLAKDTADLKERLSNIFIGVAADRSYVYARDLEAHGAMAVLLRDALRPNLVQTLEGTPALIHGGPFANIAHGCNSLVATKLALKLGDFVVTEAGFGSDLGAEKFFDIKCRAGQLQPSAAVVVATIRALRYHGTGDAKSVKQPNADAVRKGLENVEKHIENVALFGVPQVVALNKFLGDTDEELAIVQEFCEKLGVPVEVSEVWEHGGKGGESLAAAVLNVIETKESTFKPLYALEATLEDKVRTVATKVYGAKEVEFSSIAARKLKNYAAKGFGNLPVCIAKTADSLSGDKGRHGRPRDFKLTISDVRLSAGAGFVVVLAGDIMTMPGLGKVPAANGMDIKDDGSIVGLF